MSESAVASAEKTNGKLSGEKSAKSELDFLRLSSSWLKE